MAITLEGNSDYIIFFDDQHVQRFVTSFSVTIAANGSIGEAVIEMVYSNAFMDIEYMTDVKIFVKNVFNGRYRMVFDGQIHGRQVSISPTGRSIIFLAYDYMHWLQKLPVPLFFGLGDQLRKNVQLSWVARGADVRAVDTILSATDAAISGKDLRGIVEAIFNYVDKSLAHSADYSTPDKNNLYKWINIKSKIRVLSDFNPALRDNSMIELFYKGNIMENAYVLLNSIVSGVGYELYQDIDSIIKIKEPFWHDGIIKPFIIDPALIIDFNEDTRWDNKCTRVLTLGGVEEQLSRSLGGADSYARDMMIPGVVYVQGEDNSYFVTSDDVNQNTITAVPGNFVKTDALLSDEDEPDLRSQIVNEAYGFLRRSITIRYELGGGHGSRDPDKENLLDCSGFINHIYRRAGIPIGDKTAHNYFISSQEISESQLQPGDIGVCVPKKTGYDHIGIYVGLSKNSRGELKHTWMDCNKIPSQGVDGIRVRYSDRKGGGTGWWNRFGNLLTTSKRGYAGHSDINMPTGIDFREKVLPLTDVERKYGVNLVETVQPLIRVARFSEYPDRDEAFNLLKEYTKYLHTNINASASVASLTTMGAPWIRPGFNIWLDPGGLSRIYYVSSVRHQGSNGLVQTGLGLIYGRSEEEYKHLYNLNKDKPNNPFTVERRVTAKDYYLDSGELDFITPDNMDKFKVYKEKVHAFCNNKGAIPAHLSPYRDWYGSAFIRRNIDFLGRWDSDFNLFELYCIIAANYGVQDVAGLLKG